jgi:choline kinase
MSDKEPSRITVIIPAAGVGRRMKSYGPKPLIMVGKSTVINIQIDTIRSNIDARDIILICGFRADKLMNETPNSLIKIENESYEDSNVIRSIGMGLRAIRDADTVVVVYGDLVFNSAAIESLNLDQSCVIIDDGHMGPNEVGCIIDNEDNLANMMYDLPVKWGQIAVFKNYELTLLKELCWDKRNHRKFGFEIINRIIERGGGFECIRNEDIKIVDIDTSKDINTAIGILT